MRFLWLAFRLRSFARAKWVRDYDRELERLEAEELLSPARVAPEKRIDRPPAVTRLKRFMSRSA